MSIIAELMTAPKEETVQIGGLFWRLRRLESSQDLMATGSPMLLADRRRMAGGGAPDPEMRERLTMASVAAGVIGAGRTAEDVEALRVSLHEPSDPASNVLNVYDIPLGTRSRLELEIARITGCGEVPLGHGTFPGESPDPVGSTGEAIRD